MKNNILVWTMLVVLTTIGVCLNNRITEVQESVAAVYILVTATNPRAQGLVNELLHTSHIKNEDTKHLLAERAVKQYFNETSEQDSEKVQVYTNYVAKAN